MINILNSDFQYDVQLQRTATMLSALSALLVIVVMARQLFKK